MHSVLLLWKEYLFAYTLSLLILLTFGISFQFLLLLYQAEMLLFPLFVIILIPNLVIIFCFNYLANLLYVFVLFVFMFCLVCLYLCFVLLVVVSSL